MKQSVVRGDTGLEGNLEAPTFRRGNLRAGWD